MIYSVSLRGRCGAKSRVDKNSHEVRIYPPAVVGDRSLVDMSMLRMNFYPPYR